MNNKAYWVEEYLKAKKNGDEKARKKAYKELIRILGDSLKERDIK